MLGDEARLASNFSFRVGKPGVRIGQSDFSIGLFKFNRDFEFSAYTLNWWFGVRVNGVEMKLARILSRYDLS